MEISIYDFIKGVGESNKANEMALHHAVSILADFRSLTLEGRKIMVDSLIELISEEIKPGRVS